MKQILFVALCFLVVQASGQKEDATLFTVEDQEVTVSEFDYIYNKNNREGADYSEASLREYLDLYIKFKLKVQRARDMKLDTITQLQKELAGYRKQLANSYLNDREVKDRLIQEAYERMLEDVHLAHILVQVEQRASADDTLKAFRTIKSAQDRILRGESFESVALEFSEDGNSNSSGGDIGFITAIMPSGFYQVETAAYETPVGEVSGIVRSSLGYHILKVMDKRAARGKMDASHILVRFNKDNSNEVSAKKKIDQLYQQLQNGSKFEDLARKQSEDESTARRGGYIGTFGINTYDAEFEDTAFGLLKDGDISEPVKSRLGYHIIKRMRKRPIESFDRAKRRIESQISKNERIEFAKSALIGRIKKEGNFSVQDDVLNSYTESITGDLFSYRWVPPTTKEQVISSFGDEMSATNTDFGKFMRANARIRMRMPKSTPKEEVINQLFNEFAREQALAYEEQKLADKYPDFKALMREYEEGILLFEATKINVWDKASQDTIGLQDFYHTHQQNYMWDERANLVEYTLPAGNEKLLTKLKKLSTKLPSDKVVSRLNRKDQLVGYSKKTIEKDDEALGGLEWKKGVMSELVRDEENNQISFKMIESFIPPTPKSLSEARGYIIADYQDQLESEWVSSLKEMYRIQIEEQVLESMIAN